MLALPPICLIFLFENIFTEYWPFLIIIVGIYTILKTFSSKVKNEPGVIEDNNYYLDIFSLFGDKTKIIKTNNFLRW